MCRLYVTTFLYIRNAIFVLENVIFFGSGEKQKLHLLIAINFVFVRPTYQPGK